MLNVVGGFVVISLLNSFTGVAAACGGFLYDNKAIGKESRKM